MNKIFRIIMMNIFSNFDRVFMLGISRTSLEKVFFLTNKNIPMKISSSSDNNTCVNFLSNTSGDKEKPRTQGLTAKPKIIMIDPNVVLIKRSLFPNWSPTC